MNIPFVDLKAQYLSLKNDIDTAISSVIDHTSFIGGSIVSEFESEFSKFSGLQYCIGCANGTDALEIALKALGIKAGDEVIVPALTWISTGGAVNNVGAEPVFVDVLEKERTIDPKQIEDKITDRTKAIIPVHLYGLPARMEAIIEIARKYNLRVIEDAAQAHGAEIEGRKIGMFGDITTFSFYPGKNLGAYGDAGAIATNDQKLAELCKMLTNHGQLEKHQHQIIGRNSRLDTMQAAILRAKLPYLVQWVDKRIEVAKRYDSLLENVVKPSTPEGYKHVFHLYVIQSDNRDELMHGLKKAGVGCAIHYPTPLPHLDCYAYQGHREDDFPIAEKLCSEILSLPMYPELDDQKVNLIFQVINSLRLT